MTRKHVVFGQHHVLIGPQPGWEGLKVGGGAPPVRLRDRWLVLYHGVSGPSGAEATLPRRVCATVPEHCSWTAVIHARCSTAVRAAF